MVVNDSVVLSVIPVLSVSIALVVSVGIVVSSCPVSSDVSTRVVGRFVLSIMTFCSVVVPSSSTSVCPVFTSKRMNGNRVVSSVSGPLGFVANVLNVGSALASAAAFVVWIVFPAAGVVTTFGIEPIELGMMVVD